MPWKETCAVEQRMRFAVEWERGVLPVAVLRRANATRHRRRPRVRCTRFVMCSGSPWAMQANCSLGRESPADRRSGH